MGLTGLMASRIRTGKWKSETRTGHEMSLSSKPYRARKNVSVTLPLNVTTGRPPM